MGLSEVVTKQVITAAGRILGRGEKQVENWTLTRTGKKQHTYWNLVTHTFLLRKEREAGWENVEARKTDDPDVERAHPKT